MGQKARVIRLDPKAEPQNGMDHKPVRAAAMGDVWATMGPKERADMVRSHRQLSIPELCELFGLTEYGVDAILKGANWAPACSVETESPK